MAIYSDNTILNTSDTLTDGRSAEVYALLTTLRFIYNQRLTRTIFLKNFLYLFKRSTFEIICSDIQYLY